MASVKVAVRVRPLNARERSLDSGVIIDIAGKTITVTDVRVPDHTIGDQSREKTKVFTFDHSYWSVDPADSHYVSQEKVFADLGSDIIECAYNGYNACVFAYGQTGSGKTYTMTGNPGDVGLIPRISNGLFERMTDESKTYRTEVSYFEIYNEAVRDLLPSNASKVNQTLRVREHPKDGPYVEDLSCHIVTSYEDIKELSNQGNARRTTAATNMNDMSSRSHAIFTIAFTQAKFSQNSPSEMYSKIRLVDLAGSERADATGNTGLRLKEGGSINKSLVTLSNVISTLAEVCEKGTSRKVAYIPYRDSVLTWLLKDSLGGNSKTIMIATVSPAGCNYMETVSTLRYANRAKNIINKPKVNEDPNVKLIRELRAEIARLKALLGGSIDDVTTPKLQEQLSENEAKVKVLTDAWTGRWKETASILKEGAALALRRDGLGVVLDSDLPHLIGIDDDLLSTGMILYHLKEGQTTIGTEGTEEKQDIVLQGSDVQCEHCVIYNESNEVSLAPMPNADCYINGVIANSRVTLSQGDVIILGRTNMFRFNHPLQATKLRKELKESNMNLSRMSLLSQSRLEIFRSTDNLNWSAAGQSRLEVFRSTDNLNWSATGSDLEQQHKEQLEGLERKRREVEEMEEKLQAHQKEEEKELERRREILERMQAEAEKMRKEAEMVQMQVKQEASELKEKSRNFEKQLQQYKQLGGSMMGLEQEEGTAAVDNEIPPSSHPLQKEELESELRDLDESIEQLKRLQVDCSLFDSVSAHLDDSVGSKIQIEIQQMDHLLNKITDLSSRTTECHDETKRQVIARSSVALAELETRLSVTTEAEAGILKEMSEVEDSEVESGRMAELENQKMNATNDRVELEAEKDRVEESLLRELEELEQENEGLMREFEAAADEVTEHEVTYQRLIADVLRENEMKREKILERMKEMRTVDGGKTIGCTDGETNGGTDGDISRCADDTDDTEEAEEVDSRDTERVRNLSKDVVLHLPPLSPDKDHVEILLDPGECRLIRSGHVMLANGTNERRQLTEEGQVTDRGCTSEEEKASRLETLNAERHPLDVEGDGERQKQSALDLESRRREMEFGTESRENSGTSETTHLTTGGHHSMHDSISNTSSMLENFPVTSPPLLVIRESPSSSSSSYPFRVKIPCSIFRGSGLSTYVEFEVKVAVMDEEWTIFRRYRRFHQLHRDLLALYSQVSSLEFPPKRLFTTEKVVAMRRIRLEMYLQNLLEVLYKTSGCALHPSRASVYCKQLLSNFHPFFQKGIFETSKHSAC